MIIIKIIYPGAFRINTVTAVRATSAAPTFFTPVQWEQGMYCLTLSPSLVIVVITMLALILITVLILALVQVV